MTGSVLGTFCSKEEVFDCEESAADVYSISVFPCFYGQLPNARMAGFISDACIGTKDVDGPKVILCFLEAGRDRVFVRDVALNVEDVVAWRCVVKGQQVVSCDFAAGRCSCCQLMEFATLLRGTSSEYREALRLLPTRYRPERR